MFAQTQFDKWLAALQGRWPSVADLPSVDRELPEMRDGLVDVWMDLLSDSRLPIPPHDPFDPLHRFVVLNALHRLSRMGFAIDIPEDAEEARSRSHEQFLETLALLPVSSIDDVARLRWEVAAAAVGRQWARVRELFDRWRRCEPDARSAVERLRGRVLWLSVWTDREPPDLRMDELWLPGMSSIGAVADYAVFAKTISIISATGGGWPEEPALTTEEEERLVDAIAAFEKAMSGGRHDAMSIAIQASARYLVGAQRDDAHLLIQASEGYHRLVRDHEVWVNAGLPIELFPPRCLYECALRTLKRGRVLARAEALIREWMASEGEQPQIWEHLAEVQLRQNDLEGARTSILKAIANNEKYRDDWKASLLVGLASRPDSVEAVLAALAEERVRNPRSAELAEALTRRFWYPFAGLSAQAQQLWIHGVRLRHDPGLTRELTEMRVLSAGHAFALAVEIELRQRIFDGFVRREAWVASVQTSKDDTTGERELVRYAAGRGELTLGQMAFLISSCIGASSRVLAALASRIGSEAPGLFRLGDQLRRLNEHRNMVMHQTLTGPALADLESLAETFLTLLSEVPGD